jgi:hypothetical protein
LLLDVEPNLQISTPELAALQLPAPEKHLTATVEMQT